MRLAGQPEIPEGVSEQRAALIEALGPVRPFEGRLVGFEYAPVRPLPEGWRTEEVAAAIRAIDDKVELGPSPQAMADVGVVELLHGRFDQAVRRLQSAARSEPKDARILNDLAAAYLARADGNDRPMDLVISLDLLERALSGEPDLAEARFNRGVALARLGLCAPAEASWSNYLTTDRRTDWSREVLSRRNRMPCDWPDWSLVAAWAGSEHETPPRDLQRFLILSPVEVLRRTLEDLLPSWAESYIAGDHIQATRYLRRIRHIGVELRERTRDESILRSVQELEEGGETASRRLAFAYQNLGEGERLRAASGYHRAQESYRRAVQWGHHSSSPVILWSYYGIFSTLVTEGNYPEARKVASVLRASLSPDIFPALEARILWSEGLIQLRTGDFADSRQSFDASATLFSKLGDPTQHSAARALAAESLHALGLNEEAWRARLEASRELGRRPSGPLHNLLIDAALASREEGRRDAALLFQTAGLDGARALGSVSRTVEALLWRSKILASLNREDDARSDLEAALAQAPAISDPGVRKRLTADVQEAYGSLLITHNPETSITALSSAIDVYEETEYAWKLPSVFLLRARARLRQGEDALAEADLEVALGEFERRDRTMPPAIYRYSHFERAQETFDEMMRLQLARHRPEAALAYLERARLSLLPSTDGNANLLDKAVAELPEKVAVVEFAILDGRLLTWLIQGGRIRFLTQPLANLPADVEAFSEALSVRDWPRADIEKKAETLYAKMIVPWIREVPQGTHLAFSPDRFLHGMAFAALRNPQSKRWLAEDFVVTTTPSLSSSAGAHPLAKVRRSEPRSVLIGNPSFDPSELDGLVDLPGAAEEVRRISPLYPGAAVLIGPDAEKDRVLAALAQADLVHYSGHALANQRDPWTSFLVLARPADGSTGLLLAKDIHSLPHRPRRLVVLSACGRPSDGRLRSAGFSPLVSSFLAIGAESVVASLWSVDDHDILPITLELHRGFRRGLSVAEALHRAQKLMIENTPMASPHIWANLEVTSFVNR